MLRGSTKQNRYRQAREELGWSAPQLAEKMGVHISTISNIETGQRALTLDKLLLMSKVTGFTVQYLLGFDDPQVDWTKPISKEALSVMHRAPVWTASHGWGLVNTMTQSLVFADQTSISLEIIQCPIYGFPPVLAYSLYGAGEPLRLHDVEQRSRVWVEPITQDVQLSAELRGWYHTHKKRLVLNEFGHRFYLDAYGVKWLAFDNCFDDNDETDA